MHTAAPTDLHPVCTWPSLTRGTRTSNSIPPATRNPGSMSHEHPGQPSGCLATTCSSAGPKFTPSAAPARYAAGPRLLEAHWHHGDLQNGRPFRAACEPCPKLKGGWGVSRCPAIRLFPFTGIHAGVSRCPPPPSGRSWIFACDCVHEALRDTETMDRHISYEKHQGRLRRSACQRSYKT